LTTSRTIQLISTIILVLSFTGIALADELQVRQPTESEIGQPAQCPVTKMRFEVSKDTPVLDYKGKSYFFCCPGCVGDFKKNPEQYTAGGEFMPRRPSKDEIGQTRQCPVSKTEFPVTSDTPVLDYKGKSYFFCCPPCIDEFKENPGKFIK
jgi:YHS domain-containing protein